MKSLTLKTTFVAVLLFALFSCSDDSADKPEIVSENFGQKSGPNYGSKFHFCIFDIEYGKKVWVIGGGYFCDIFQAGICNIRIRECIIFWERPCLFPCGLILENPWDIYELINPKDLISIVEKFDVKIDPRKDFIPFPVTENVLGLQFYSEIDKVINEEVLVLESDLELDPKFARENGLKGNIVPAGKYPVIVNPENKTFNAFVSVGAARK